MQLIAQAQILAVSHPVATALVAGVLLAGMALAKNKNVFLKMTSKDFALEFKAEDPQK